MGPRSVERGIFANAGPFSKFFARFNGAALCRARNPDAVSIHQSRLNQLQWGRALSSAESKRLRYLPESGTALQWGRALSSAESYSAKNTDGLKEIASMGPRSVERGIRLAPSLSTAATHSIVRERLRFVILSFPPNPSFVPISSR